MFRGIILALILSLMPFSFAAYAGEHADADFTRAMKMLDSTPPDADGAIVLLRKSAEAGNIDASYNLGVALYNRMTPSDRIEAIKWFKTAADAGSAKAQFNLATAYEDGTKETPVETVISLYQRAASAGVVESMHRLGMIFSSGEYAQKDIVNGLSWLLLADTYKDVDLAPDLKTIMAIASGDEKKMARLIADKSREKFEKNPNFKTNVAEYMQEIRE